MTTDAFGATTDAFDTSPLGFDEYAQHLPKWTDEYARQKAEEKGCTVEFADDHTLQIDIDNSNDYDKFWSQHALLLELGLFKTEWPVVRTSRNGNWHFTIRLVPPLTMLERILLQAVLGSDRKRELLSYAGMLKGQEHPVVLFRPKVEVPMPEEVELF